MFISTAFFIPCRLGVSDFGLYGCPYTVFFNDPSAVNGINAFADRHSGVTGLTVVTPEVDFASLAQVNVGSKNILFCTALKLN